jgi:adenylate cyclase
MAEERVQRHLAAILAADVVGFSRLMGEDEVGTLARLKALRTEIFEPKTTLYGGRIFKNTGDGALAEFSSAVDAVLSGIEVQQALASHNANIPQDQRIELRIGISLGDVMVEGDDLFGNGVNVAARMETLSKPGGICVSGNVHEHLLAGLDFRFEDLGEQEVKNIDRPVRAYLIGTDALTAEMSATPGKAPSAPDTDPAMQRPAVAVLPFDNLTRDPEQEYFSDGLTEDIITALSYWRTFPVIARNSTFTYKGHPVKVQEVAKELGARYIIEGSVRRGGDRVRVTVQLIDAETGHHVWAERYDRRIDDIFALQDEITERIAATVAPELERAERQRAVSKQPSSLQAWDFHLRGMSFLHEFSKEGNQQARQMFEQAVALDPTYVAGYTGISYSYHRDVLLGFADDPEQSTVQCLEAAERAIALDDTDPFAHFALSRAFHLTGRIEQALREANLAIESNPNDLLGYASLGHLLISAERPEEGIAALDRALRLSPKDPRLYLFLTLQSAGHFVVGRYDEAAALAKDAANRHPDDPLARVFLVAALGKAGRVEEARKVLAEYGQIDPTFVGRSWVIKSIPEDGREQVFDGLRSAGWED